MSKFSINTGLSQLDMKISDGRKHFWQWDTGCHLIVFGCPDVSELHYFRQGLNEPMVLKVYESGNKRVCVVPDEILQEANEFIVYAYLIEDDGNITKFSKSFIVKARPKPADYVYTETETLTYADLDKRITALEKNQGNVDITKDVEEAVEKYMTEHPIEFPDETDPTVSEWAKQPTKPKYTADEVGALPKDTTIPTKTSQLDNDSGFLTEHQDISGKADKTYVDKQIGDIETALDNIITLQNKYIGGELT